jgi:hypothetical protein
MIDRRRFYRLDFIVIIPRRLMECCDRSSIRMSEPFRQFGFCAERFRNTASMAGIGQEPRPGMRRQFKFSPVEPPGRLQVDCLETGGRVKETSGDLSDLLDLARLLCLRERSAGRADVRRVRVSDCVLKLVPRVERESVLGATESCRAVCQGLLEKEVRPRLSGLEGRGRSFQTLLRAASIRS